MGGGDEKTCPKCAETVKQAAAVCRYCSYNFVAGRASIRPQVAAHPAVANGYGRSLIAISAVIITLFAIGMSQTRKTPVEPETRAPATASVPTAQPTVSATAATVSKAFGKNEVAAAQTYGAGPVDISGSVDRVVDDGGGDARLILSVSGTILGVQGRFDTDQSPSLGPVKAGRQATMRCKGVSEFMGAPSFDNCILINAGDPAGVAQLTQ
jgi:hypothetical protein